MKTKGFVSVFVGFALLTHQSIALAETAKGDVVYTRPDNVPARSNSEYYSPAPELGLVMPVNIWGNVKEPGLHYVPLGASLQHSISVAGGPTDAADIDSVRLSRNGKIQYADLLGPKSIQLQANDYVYVDRNFRSDVPLIISGISAVLTVVTLYFVLNPRKSSQ